MTELDPGKSTSSRPPPSGLVTHTRLERARQHLRTGLDHLCGQFHHSDDEPPSSRPSTEVQVAMVGQLLRRQLEFEQSQLLMVAFPALPELRTEHEILVGKLTDLERALAAGSSFVHVSAIAEDLRHSTLQYFEWLDGFFGKVPHSYE